MTTPGLIRSSSTRSVKKLEKPRPLKISSNLNRSTSSELSPRYSGVSWDEIMLRVDDVSQCISNQNFDDSLLSLVYSLNMNLKMYGQQLESIYKDQLDRAFVIFRNGCSNDRVNRQCRAYLLELIELRANQWLNCDSICSYYNNRMSTTDIEPLTTPDALSSGIGLMNLQASSPTNTTVLGPGEVLKTSGKYPKPTKISGKNYCKDEVVIRNSDSGKVNPGAKERLVQITGPSEDKITHARQLMEDTIRRNASPVREVAERERMGGSSSSLNSSASDESNRLPQFGMRPKMLPHSFSTNDANIGEYKHTVTIGNEDIKIYGKNHQLVTNVKLFLEENYNGWTRRQDSADSFLVGGDEDVFMTPVMDGNGEPTTSTSGPTFDYLTNQQSFMASQSERRAVLGRSVSQHSNNHFDFASNFEDTIGTSRVYSKEFLLECSLSPLSKHPPPEWDVVVKELPAIVKKVPLMPTYSHPTPCNYSYNKAWANPHQYTYA